MTLSAIAESNGITVPMARSSLLFMTFVEILT